MNRKFRSLLTVAVYLATLSCAGYALAQDDTNDVPSQSLYAGGDPNKHYFLIGAEENLQPPEEGFSLLIVLPGGDGSEDFHPFVKQIYKNALSKKYLLAQLVAPKWTADQEITWPTKQNQVPGQKFSTEEFLTAVVNEIESAHKINEKEIFTLSWSSGGPAAYAISLDKTCPVTGSYISMSVFKPDFLPPLETAKGHAYYIEHSPEDKVCPIRMARQAHRMLRQNGARTRFATYEGGHGWQGHIYPRIRKGIRWLEVAARRAARRSVAPTTDKEIKEVSQEFPITDGFEPGESKPIGWRRGVHAEGVEYIWDTNSAYEGKASLCLKKTTSEFFPIAQWYRRFEYDGSNAPIKVHVKVKAENIAKAIVDVQFIDGNDELLGHKWAAYIGAKNANDPPANHDWQDYGGTVDIPQGTDSVVIALQIYGPGTVWFDDLTLGHAND